MGVALPLALALALSDCRAPGGRRGQTLFVAPRDLRRLTRGAGAAIAMELDGGFGGPASPLSVGRPTFNANLKDKYLALMQQVNGELANPAMPAHEREQKRNLIVVRATRAPPRSLSRSCPGREVAMRV